MAPNVCHCGLLCGPVSVLLSLWNVVCLRDSAPARRYSVSSVVDQLVCGLTPYPLQPPDGLDLQQGVLES